ncbi:zeta toxin family protein [Vibrio cholerae]|uniref:zeta toxin family protein n=2 Tax=Vibrio cholerae TaxID=666 RepID=UPI00115C37F4|nr:zeta toxin family protein [Vibrio cholerae]ELF6904135.1 zeta toxin family protein [Vibrio cholerae]TQP37541.1 AAA family ATPase [Vibrio cholerae]TQP61565.1 AAA family ATPase [Vibrio cholerae]
MYNLNQQMDEASLKTLQDNFYYEILAFDDFLKEYDVENDKHKRMVLAREIALIEHLQIHFDFKKLIVGDEDREYLKEQILNELVSMSIPKDDDDIRIGFGGSKPRNRIRYDKKAIILLGLPASGKSTVAQVMSDMQGAYIIDSDFAKRKFPELAFPNGANWTHDESDDLVHGNDDCVLVRCLKDNANMVIPKVGANAESIKKVYEMLTSYGYSVSLGLVWLEPKKALQRAISRYQKSKRYVPIPYIINAGDAPKSVFEMLISELSLECHVHLSSDVDIGEPCVIKKISDHCIWW